MRKIYPARERQGERKYEPRSRGSKVTDSGISEFAKCTKLKSVTVKSKDLLNIGEQVFEGDKTLKSITLKTTKNVQLIV